MPDPQELFRAAGGLQIAQAMMGERGERRSTPMWVIDQAGLERFAELVRAAEKERAATRCDQVAAHVLHMTPREVAVYLAAAIRSA